MFSVLLSLYIKEHPEFLKQSLDSLFTQTLPPDEIVLVLDGPLTQELNEVVSAYATRYDRILKVVPLPQNLGLGRALNEGLKHCSYELVARMDTDDIAKPERFAKQIAIFEKYPEVDVVSAWLDEFEGDVSRIRSIKKLPEWDMSDIYPSPDSERFHDDIRRVREIGDEIIEHCSDPHFPLLSLIKLKDEGDALIVTLTAYTEALLETDSENKAYLKALNESEEISVFYDKAEDAFVRCVSARKDEFSSPELSEYRYYLDRIAVEGSHLMSEAEEALASELARTGENAWQRLMSSVTSTAADGDKTLIELRALASDPDRTIRKDAYERELKLLDTHKTAVAAALNGVKGSVLTLERRRGWADLC